MSQQVILRKSEERGHVDHGWLKAKHSFSFASYYDPRFMGFSDLLVINEDRVAPGKGFATHGHEDMEIITYVISGAVEHKDSMGNTEVVPAGDIQVMSAGTGVRHSEYNPDASTELHLLQIWIQPNAKGLRPGYGQVSLAGQQELNTMNLIVGPEGSKNQAPLTIRQDAFIYSCQLQQGSSATVSSQQNADRNFWIQMIDGRVVVDGQELAAGDGLAVLNGKELTFIAVAEHSHFLVFDLRTKE